VDSTADVDEADGGGPLTVTVDLSAPRAIVAEHAFEMHASVYDNALHDPALPTLLVKLGGGGTISSAVRWDYVPTGNLDGGDVVGPTPADGLGNEFVLAMPPEAVTDVILSGTS
jgi:hypothetical protein